MSAFAGSSCRTRRHVHRGAVPVVEASRGLRGFPQSLRRLQALRLEAGDDWHGTIRRRESGKPRLRSLARAERGFNGLNGTIRPRPRHGSSKFIPSPMHFAGEGREVTSGVRARGEGPYRGMKSSSARTLRQNAAISLTVASMSSSDTTSFGECM